MKIKSAEYAKALVEAMETKNDKKIIVNFFALLQKNGDLKKAKEIVQLTETLYLKKSGAKRLTIETARPVGKALLKNIAKKGDVLEEKINPSLIAGVKIVIDNEKQLDISLKNKLDTIL